jgi:hypothetical protein
MQKYRSGVVQKLVANLHDSLSTKLTKRERWRMPLVVMKTMRWQRLQEGDARIFQRIQANMKTEQDIIRMESAMRVAAAASAPAASEAPLLPGSGLARKSFSYGADNDRAKVRKKRNSISNTRNSLLRAKPSPLDSEEGGFESFGDDVASVSAIKYVVSTFTALGTSIKASFSGKRRSSVIAPISEALEMENDEVSRTGRPSASVKVKVPARAECSTPPSEDAALGVPSTAEPSPKGTHTSNKGGGGFKWPARTPTLTSAGSWLQSARRLVSHALSEQRLPGTDESTPEESPEPVTHFTRPRVKKSFTVSGYLVGVLGWGAMSAAH